MKTLKILCITAILFFCGCQYPESQIDDVSLRITGSADDYSGNVTLNGILSGVDEAIVSEYGFSYSSSGGYGSPAGKQKHIVDAGRFIWNLNVNSNPNVVYVRAYVVADGIMIYSSNEITISEIRPPV